MSIIKTIDLKASGEYAAAFNVSWNSIKREGGSPTKFDKTISAVSSSSLTFRTFDMPFGDKRKVRDMVREELDFSLAFDVENAVWDFVIDREGHALCCAAMKDAVDIGKTDVIDCDFAALSRTVLFCGHTDAVVVDIGARKTVMLSIKDSSVSRAGVNLLGGNFITDAVCRKDGLSFDAAEEIKKKEGLKHAGVKDCFLLFAENIKGFIKEEEPKTVILTGGTSLLPGLKDELEAFCGIKFGEFSLPEGVSPYFDAVCFGCALREKYPLVAVNFAPEKTEKLPVKAIALMLLPLFLLPLHFFIEGLSLDKETDCYREAVNQMPVVKRLNMAGKDIHTIKAQVELEVKKNGKKSSKGTLYVLDALVKASEAFNTSPSTIVYTVDVSKDILRIQGEADSFNDIENIKKLLEKKFKSVKVTEGKTLPSKRIKFTYQLKS